MGWGKTPTERGLAPFVPAKPKSAFMPKGYEMNNKLMEEMNKKKVNIASSVQFRNDILESQKKS